MPVELIACSNPRVIPMFKTLIDSRFVDIEDRYDFIFRFSAMLNPIFNIPKNDGNRPAFLLILY